MKQNERQRAHKTIAYVLKGGCAQPACRDDQSDTTTIPQRGAPSRAFGSLVLYFAARPCTCKDTTNFTSCHLAKHRIAKRAIKCPPLTIVLSASVKVVPHVKAIWAAGLSCLTMVSVLLEFAVSPTSTIASHIKVPIVFLHCVSSTASCRKLFNNWGALFSRPLCCALLCCPASFRLISIVQQLGCTALVSTVLRPIVLSSQLSPNLNGCTNLMMRTSKLVIHSSTSPILAVTSLLSSSLSGMCTFGWMDLPPVTAKCRVKGKKEWSGGAPAATSCRHTMSQWGGGIHKVRGGVHLDVGVLGRPHRVSTHGIE